MNEAVPKGRKCGIALPRIRDLSGILNYGGTQLLLETPEIQIEDKKNSGCVGGFEEAVFVDIWREGTVYTT